MEILNPTLHLDTNVRLRARRMICVAGFALLFLGTQNLSVQAVSKEYEVKAAFLYNFSQFIEWPASVLSGSQSPLVIGVLGDDPFGNYLDTLVRGETVNNHPLIVQRFRQVEQIKTCHILFVSQSEEKQLEYIFNYLKGRNILTVGDADNFAVRGGMIRFITENNKIHFRINLGAATAAKLTISSKLLRAAEIVSSR